MNGISILGGHRTDFAHRVRGRRPARCDRAYGERVARSTLARARQRRRRARVRPTSARGSRARWIGC